MQIEIRARESFLEEFRLHLEDELRKNSYSKGPEVASLGSGHVETFIKDDIILSLQVKDISNTEECVFHLESESEVEDLKQIWDRAVIQYGRKLIERLRNMAQNVEFVQKELKLGN